MISVINGQELITIPIAEQERYEKLLYWKDCACSEELSYGNKE